MYSTKGFAINCSPINGKKTIMNGISAQCIAQIVDAENPIRSSFNARLCLIVFIMILLRIVCKINIVLLFSNTINIKLVNYGIFATEC